jgi:hypothetical protein
MLQTKFNFPAIYNPANQTKEELIANFVVRLKEFHTIFDVIKKDGMKKTPPQHFIIQGPRGSGKTTLLLRFFYAVADDKKLEKFLIPVIFDEEQYNIRTLFKFWEEIALYLEEEHESLFYGLYDEMQKYIEKVDYEETCFSLLQQRLQESRRKLLLFIDNFGDMLAKFRRKERQRLREVLIQCSDIRIVGGSSVVLEFHYDYSEPFFEFFKVIPLEGLNQKETVELLLQLSETYKTETVKQIVKSNPGRIEALRRLTSGVPRTIILLFEIFLDHEKGNSFQDLEIILDRVTPLYKHRMDGLPPQKQDIVDAIALSWDAVGVKEIVSKTRIPSKAVSAHLNELEKNRIIRKIPTSTKNNLYQVAERFFNIWYLMRHGRKRERNKVLWLVRFLESWCSVLDLVLRALIHIEALKTRNIPEKHAFYMTEALAGTKIPSNTRNELIMKTREYLNQKGSALSKELSLSDKELYDEAIKYFEYKEYDLSLNKFKKIRDKNPCTNLISTLGELIYKEIKNFKIAKQFFMIAVENGHIVSMYKLAFLYHYELKDFKKAEKYYLMAADGGHIEAMHKLSSIYFKFEDFKKAEKYSLMAVENGHHGAMYNLASLYMREKRNKYEALNLSREAYENFKDFTSAGLYFIILLWNNDIERAIQIFNADLNNEDEMNEKFSSVTILLFLLAKRQYHFTYKIFKENKLEIKDKFKPIYYALIYFMRDTYPDEYKKMGPELKETVEEIIKAVNLLAIDYK